MNIILDDLERFSQNIGQGLPGDSRGARFPKQAEEFIGQPTLQE
jgi:hypothetical protein